jgi:hypothetical protein
MEDKDCVGYVLYSLHVCVCVVTSSSTTASDNTSSSEACVVCTGRFPRGVPRGGKYAPPGYAQRIVLFLAVY